MSTTSISRIQHRRGKRENLPTLAQGELGWTIDERKLYIGNGTGEDVPVDNENIEVLTERSIGEKVAPYSVKTATSLITNSTSNIGIQVSEGESKFIKYKVMNDNKGDGIQAGLLIAVNSRNDLISIIKDAVDVDNGPNITFSITDDGQIQARSGANKSFTMTYTEETL